MSESLHFEVDERGVATMTLNRPEVRNAFDHELIEQLGARLLEVREREDIRALVITGAGRAFCAGGDQSVRGDGGYVGEDGLPGWITRRASDPFARTITIAR